MISEVNEVAVQPEAVEVQADMQGLKEQVSSSLSPQSLLEKIKSSKDKLIEMGIYLGIGFLAGFLLKKYSKYVLTLLVFVGALVVLQQFELITIVVHGEKVQELLGIQSTTSMDANILAVYWEWVKLNFAIVLSFSIGFLVGLKVG